MKWVDRLMILYRVLSDVSGGPRASSYEEILQCTCSVHVTYTRDPRLLRIQII